MKTYRMPVSLSDEDRVFGGVLSARQFITLAGGFLLGGVAVLVLPPGFWSGVLKAFFVLFFLGIGAALAFVRVTARELRLDQYLVLRFLSDQASKEYPYRGFEASVEVIDPTPKGLSLWRKLDRSTS